MDTVVIRPVVLVVEDDPQSLEILSRRLQRKGFQVRTAKSGTEAIAEATADPPHAMTLDIRLPDVDGLEVIAALQEQPDTRDIPIILVTGNVDSHLKNDYRSIGARYFIRKPYDPRLLVQLLNAVTLNPVF